MLREVTLPVTLSRVLDPLRSCFTAPTFETFTALVGGLVAQPVGRTVCGMLTGAGLARVWHLAVQPCGRPAAEAPEVVHR